MQISVFRCTRKIFLLIKTHQLLQVFSRKHHRHSRHPEVTVDRPGTNAIKRFFRNKLVRFYREKNIFHSGLIIATSVIVMILGIDILKLTGRNQGRVFKFRRGCLHAMQLYYFETKLPNLKLKNRPKQLLGSLPVDISLPVLGVRITALSIEIKNDAV
jgi:hypothetical protein